MMLRSRELLCERNERQHKFNNVWNHSGFSINCGCISTLRVCLVRVCQITCNLMVPGNRLSRKMIAGEINFIMFGW